ncbi:hypothetical protein Goklo_013721, partial [Gossypium klotzschianum]|nr:hypothetical protein [Gossypium klotzschianum]
MVDPDLRLWVGIKANLR